MVRQVNCLTFMISNLLAFDRGLMGKFGDPHQCITLHPGFQDVCLNRHVLEIAALGLKTKAGKSYRTMFLQGQRTEAEFLRSVAYRQFTRLLWEFIGRSILCL
ncbi:hypothetical protein OS493_002075 [Desmophyllum pertusum]|uniref:Uncharacterized protein n=1 Tax=Desmophyllum pertusum TaxID=174260 RepID=A0A9W9Z896_9CNID|nr:hypothetical protein OS493_002075 [Desmophyllum pertusum]